MLWRYLDAVPVSGYGSPLGIGPVGELEGLHCNDSDFPYPVARAFSTISDGREARYSRPVFSYRLIGANNSIRNWCSFRQFVSSFHPYNDHTRFPTVAQNRWQRHRFASLILSGALPDKRLLKLNSPQTHQFSMIRSSSLSVKILTSRIPALIW